MVIVIVRNDHGIDRRQPVKIHSGGNPAMRSGELHRRSAITPHGICQHVQSAYLEEKRGVSNPGNGEELRVCARNDIIGGNLHEDSRIRIRTSWISPSLDQGPF